MGDTVSLPVRYQWSLNGAVVDTTRNVTVASSASASSATLTYVLQTKHCTTQTQTITIVVDDGCNPPLETESLIPNVFTPNGDGVNDTFEFKVVGAKNLQFTIYNRWGISLTPTLSKGEGAISTTQTIIWDGRTTSGEGCSAGVYFYVLEYTNANDDVKKKNGYISLIR